MLLYGANPLTRFASVVCIALAAHAVKKDLLRDIRDIIFFIAIYSVVIWLLTSFIPPIDNYLVNLAAKYPSLNVDTAKHEGGGLNIIIYNFYEQWYSQLIGFRRNCGPFWEPGMFAVYLNLALFINVALLDNKRSVNIILGIALFTTFSTGGYVTFLFVLLLFLSLSSNNKSNVLNKGLLLGAIIAIAWYMSGLEYVADKLENQMISAEVGSDASRFGAILTHLKIYLILLMKV